MKRENLAQCGILLALCAGVLFATPVTSFAEENRFYGGIGFGLSEMKPDTEGTTYSVADSTSMGGKLYLGYDLLDYFSVEGYYSDLGEAKMSPNGRISYRDLGVSGLLYLLDPGEKRSGLMMFLRAGVGKMYNDTSLNYSRVNDSHFMLGAGFEYGLSGGYSLRLDLDMYDKDARLATLSVMKRFGSKPAPVIIRPPEPEQVVDGDADNDGVPDSKDKCPASEALVRVDVSGCEMKQVIVLKGVTFASNSAELIGDSHTVLDLVAESLKRYQQQQIEVAGYTDDRGNAAYNKQLSLRRAEAVRDYLIKRGVVADNLTASGYGEENPVADNKRKAGRAQNRRVELHKLN